MVSGAPWDVGGDGVDWASVVSGAAEALHPTCCSRADGRRPGARPKIGHKVRAKYSAAEGNGGVQGAPNLTLAWQPSGHPNPTSRRCAHPHHRRRGMMIAATPARPLRFLGLSENGSKQQHIKRSGFGPCFSQCPFAPKQPRLSPSRALAGGFPAAGAEIGAAQHRFPQCLGLLKKHTLTTPPARPISTSIYASKSATKSTSIYTTICATTSRSSETDVLFPERKNPVLPPSLGAKTSICATTSRSSETDVLCSDW